jgi:hypothetical protein
VTSPLFEGFKSPPVHHNNSRSLSLSKQLIAAKIAHELKAGLNKLASFLFCAGHFGGKVIVWKVDELRVEQGIVERSMAQDLLDIQNIFGSMVFHGCFPMPKGVKVHLKEPWVL